MREIGQDVSDVLDYEPGSLHIVRHVRPKLACATCSTITQAPTPSRPIDCCMAGTGLLAHVLVQVLHYWNWGTGKLRQARIVAMKDRQATLVDEQSKERLSVLYAAIVPADQQPNASYATSTSPAPAAPLRRPPEINRKEDFRVGQRVSFVDQSLKHQFGEIKCFNQRTATVHCDGRAWRVGFGLLQHVADITP